MFKKTPEYPETDYRIDSRSFCGYAVRDLQCFKGSSEILRLDNFTKT